MKEGGEKEKKKRGRNFLVWVSKFKSNLHGHPTSCNANTLAANSYYSCWRPLTSQTIWPKVKHLKYTIIWADLRAWEDDNFHNTFSLGEIPIHPQSYLDFFVSDFWKPYFHLISPNKHIPWSLATKEGLLIFVAFCGWVICCFWSGTGDVVVAKKRRESNVREICVWFFFSIVG